MKSFIRNLSTPAEFCIVVLVCFWWVIIAGVRQLATHLTHTAEPEPITNGLLLRVIVMEILRRNSRFGLATYEGGHSQLLGHVFPGRARARVSFFSLSRSWRLFFAFC